MNPVDPWVVMMRSFHFASHRFLPREEPVLDTGDARMWVKMDGFTHIYVMYRDVNEFTDMSFYRILFIYGGGSRYARDVLVGAVKQCMYAGLDLPHDVADALSSIDAVYIRLKKYWYFVHLSAYVMTDVVSAAAAVAAYTSERRPSRLRAIIDAPETYIVTAAHAVESIPLHAYRRYERVAERLMEWGIRVDKEALRRAIRAFLENMFYSVPQDQLLNEMALYVAPVIGLERHPGVLLNAVYSVAAEDAERGDIDFYLAGIAADEYRYGELVYELHGCEVLSDKTMAALLPERDTAELRRVCEKEEIG